MTETTELKLSAKSDGFTVAELIQRLSTLPEHYQSLPVYIIDGLHICEITYYSADPEDRFSPERIELT